MLPVVRSEEAEKDLSDIIDFLDAVSPTAADRLIDDIEQRCRVLASNPYLGRARDELGSGLRSLSVNKYIVFYCVLPNEIQIVRIFHGSQNYAAEFGDESDD